MSVIIRNAQWTDATVIEEFNRLLALETEQKRLDPAVLAVGVAAALKDADKGRYFVAEDGGAVVGQIMHTREWSDWRNGWIWWIQSVYVRQEWRRRGVFRALYQHVHQAARSDPSVIGIRLYMEKDNETARKTYLSLGMKEPGYVVLECYPLQ